MLLKRPYKYTTTTILLATQKTVIAIATNMQKTYFAVL